MASTKVVPEPSTALQVLLLAFDMSPDVLLLGHPMITAAFPVAVDGYFGVGREERGC